MASPFLSPSGAHQRIWTAATLRKLLEKPDFCRSASLASLGTRLAQRPFVQTLTHNPSHPLPWPQASEPVPAVRRAMRADVRAIVALQAVCLPHFYLVDPGRAFLRSFYSHLLRDRRGLLFVAEHDRQLAGFVAGFFDPASLYREIAPQQVPRHRRRFPLPGGASHRTTPVPR